MKNKMKKIISLVLVLAISFTISIPAFAADKDENKATTTVQIQENNCQSLYALSRKNILKANGFVYGPWFGYVQDEFNSNIKGYANLAGDIAEGLSLVIPNAKAKILAGSIAYLCKMYVKYGRTPAYTYGTIDKKHREVKYSDGTFAYFETHYKIHTYMVDDEGDTYDLGYTEKTFKGNAPMLNICQQ